MRQQTPTLWLLRNFWVGIWSMVIGLAGPIVAFVFILLITIAQGHTTRISRLGIPFTVFYAGSFALIFIAVGVVTTLPRPLVQPTASWWGPKQRITAAVSGIALLVIILGVLVLHNGTTSPDLIAAIVGIAAVVVGIIPLLSLRNSG